MTSYSYTDPVCKLIELGRPDTGAWPDYIKEIGLTREHIPELIRLVQDRDLRFTPAPDDSGENADLPEWYAQIHAWRALAQLKAVEAIPAMLGILHQIDEEDDDWLGEESFEFFPMFGPVAIAPLAAYLADQNNLTYARVAASESLQKMAEAHPETREDCIAAIVAALQEFRRNDETVNAFLISALIDLKALEHLPLVEQAFQAGRVEEIVVGDFEDVQIELGLLAERKTPPRYGLPDNWLAPRELGQGVGGGHAGRKEGKKEKAKRKQEKLSRKKNRKKKKKK